MFVVHVKLSYSKTGNKKRATCFATLLQNEMNTDVARFTTRIRTCLATNFSWVVKLATAIFN